MLNIDHLRAAVLDTHVWVWMCAGDSRVASLADFTGRGVISAISVWEVAMLEAKGRLVLEPSLKEWIDSNTRAPVELVPIDPTICNQSCNLADFHGDPADRLIVATAWALGLPLITADAKIIEWNRRHAVLQMIAI